MQIEILTMPQQIQAMAEEWNALLVQSASDVPFLKPEYLTTWWQYLGGGEWETGSLHVVVARKEDSTLLGIAPLFHTHNAEGQPTLMFIGTYEISDYLDLIARPEDLPEFVKVLYTYLASDQAPEWQSLDLFNILHESPSLGVLEEEAREQSWAFTQVQLQHAPFVPLEGGWEAYLASLDKKQRHELRRKMRKAAGHIIPVEWYTVEDETTLDAELDAFFGLMMQDPNKKNFLTPSMQTQMRAVLWTAFKHGWLQFNVLKVGKEIAAALVNFDYANRLWAYNSGQDMRFRDLSSGVVLTGHVLEYAAENGYEAFDFMRGDEKYKYRMGGVDRFVMRATIRKP